MVAAKHIELKGDHPDAPIPADQRGKLTSSHIVVQRLQPHWVRRKAIMKAHPEIQELQVVRRDSALWVLAIVAIQTVIAYAVSLYEPAWYVTFLAGYCIGAVADHAMWVLIHDLTHDAVFESRSLNNVFHLIANLPLVYPSTISFKFFHQQHHVHLNEAYGDPDVPGELENKIFGTTTLGKAAWLLLFPLVQVYRTSRYPMSMGAMGVWAVANWVIQMAWNVLMLQLFGWSGMAYLLISSTFAIGLHPLGARWIAEHYSTNPPQETYSYYGPLNLLSFNIGYHNEHHDLPRVPWQHLPEVKRRAPEFYDYLDTHPSYVRLLWEFLTDPGWTLESRVVRKTEKDQKVAEAQEYGSVQSGGLKKVV